MKKETADVLVRVYPSDYKHLSTTADKRRTIIAEIVHEAVAAAKLFTLEN